MLNPIPSHLSELPVYQKAMDIITLSRSISTYLGHDLSYLNSDGSENSNIYFTGDIVQQSTSIAPEIANAELERFSDKKHQHFASIQQLTNRLYHNCKRLTRCNSNGKDYLPILQIELKKFKQLQKTWMLTL